MSGKEAVDHTTDDNPRPGGLGPPGLGPGPPARAPGPGPAPKR